MKVSSVKEYLAAYTSHNELPEFEFGNSEDEALASTLMQVRLGLMEDDHHMPLAKIIIGRGVPSDFQASKALNHMMELKSNRLINLAINIDMPMTEEMILYYAAKSFEETGMGQLGLDDDYTDDWYVYHFYHRVMSKARLFNLFQYSKDQELIMINNAIERLVKQSNKIQAELDSLYSRKTILEL